MPSPGTWYGQQLRRRTLVEDCVCAELFFLYSLFFVFVDILECVSYPVEH